MHPPSRFWKKCKIFFRCKGVKYGRYYCGNSNGHGVNPACLGDGAVTKSIRRGWDQIEERRSLLAKRGVRMLSCWACCIAKQIAGFSDTGGFVYKGEHLENFAHFYKGGLTDARLYYQDTQQIVDDVVEHKLVGFLMVWGEMSQRAKDEYMELPILSKPTEIVFEQLSRHTRDYMTARELKFDGNKKYCAPCFDFSGQLIHSTLLGYLINTIGFNVTKIGTIIQYEPCGALFRPFFDRLTQLKEMAKTADDKFSLGKIFIYLQIANIC